MTKKEIIKNIFGELSNKRHIAEIVAQKNKKLALENVEYANLEIKERELNMEIGKCRFEQADCSKFEKELEKVLAKKLSVLKEIGLSEEDLLPKYECEKCLDTGVFENEICSCVSQMFNNKLMEICNVDLSKTPLLNNYNFEFFAEDNEKNFAKKCVKTLKEYVESFRNLTLKNIIMSGASGTGKTFLTQCLAKELIAKNITTLFISSFDLNRLFLEQHLSSYGEKDNMKTLIDVDVLIIDDLGTEPMRKNVSKEYLLILLNERIAKNKSTIITTNLNPEQVLDKYEERVFSRIFNKRTTLVLQFNGKNERLKK